LQSFHPNLLAVGKHNERNDAPRKGIILEVYISVHASVLTKRISLITLSSHTTLSTILKMEIGNLERLLDYSGFLEVVLF
jgi:hypothetical protein